MRCSRKLLAIVVFFLFFVTSVFTEEPYQIGQVFDSYEEFAELTSTSVNLKWAPETNTSNLRIITFGRYTPSSIENSIVYTVYMCLFYKKPDGSSVLYSAVKREFDVIHQIDAGGKSIYFISNETRQTEEWWKYQIPQLEWPEFVPGWEYFVQIEIPEPEPEPENIEEPVAVVETLDTLSSDDLSKPAKSIPLFVFIALGGVLLVVVLILGILFRKN